jgi:hypothetical protein
MFRNFSNKFNNIKNKNFINKKPVNFFFNFIISDLLINYKLFINLVNYYNKILYTLKKKNNKSFIYIWEIFYIKDKILSLKSYLYRYIDFSNSLLNNDLRFKFKKINIDNLDCNFINLKRIRIVFENIFDQSILSKFFILSLKLDGFFRKIF